MKKQYIIQTRPNSRATARNSSTMETIANVSDVTFGTGYQIFLDSLLPAIEAAESEIILVTCFWAASPTRGALGQSLVRLSRRAQQQGKRIRVRIGFSSTSVLQKLTQRGPRTYTAAEWHPTLGLPAELAQLQGLDLEITSMFYLPFSVWHPKFLLVDRATVFLPSCNVSWEDWFEVCVRFIGPVVPYFLRFWTECWERHLRSADFAGEWAIEQQQLNSLQPMIGASDTTTTTAPKATRVHFLPSPHSRNPQFRVLPWHPTPPPPPTPLNTHLLNLLTTARTEIYLQTPNVTAEPVRAALLAALARGCNVYLRTSARLMILEQLVTAGTTTAMCVGKLIKDYEALLSGHGRDGQGRAGLQKASGAEDRGAEDRAGLQADAEAHVGLPQPGRLRIAYYRPRENAAALSQAGTPSAEPVQAHAKITIVDGKVVVFGSGNMDRASWYTSQELGVAVYSREVAQQVRTMLEREMVGREEVVFEPRGADDRADDRAPDEVD